jgi:excisionase family DNA binding protein
VTDPAMIERYITADELAELMGVSIRTVKRWTSEGMPSETWGMRARRYRLSEAISWARDRGAPHDIIDLDNDRAARRNERPPTQRR